MNSRFGATLRGLRYPVLACAVLLAASLSGCKVPSPPLPHELLLGECNSSDALRPKAEWTYMVYIAGDNSLTTFAGKDLQEMLAANSDDNVRLAVMIEQSPTGSPGEPSEARRGLITKDCNGLEKISGNTNMSDKQTLTDFINWAKDKHPAKRYGLVLWSHGAGWKREELAQNPLKGALYDDTSSPNVGMKVKDIASAIEAAGGVDLINFDACLMQMYEVAYQVRKAAKYLVGSEEAIPGNGNPYTDVVNHLVDDPGMDAGTLAKTIVKDFSDDYRKSKRDSVQLSAIDLGQMDAVHEKVQTLSAALKMELAGTGRADIARVRGAVPYYNYKSNKDLALFADGLSTSTTLQEGTRAAARAAAAQVRSAVIANDAMLGTEDESSPGFEKSTGLAIFIPENSQTTDGDLRDYASDLSSNASAPASGSATWISFVTALLGSDGTPVTQQTMGPFSYYITWDNAAVDLDLKINEPNGNWAGPAYGTSSLNGFSSGDSYLSGRTFESYTANQQLAKGSYEVFVTYNGCHANVATCGGTTVSLYRFDPNPPHNDTDYVKVADHVLSADRPLPDAFYNGTYGAFVSAIQSGSYTDWWFNDALTRAQDGEAGDKASHLALPKRPHKMAFGESK